MANFDRTDSSWSASQTQDAKSKIYNIATKETYVDKDISLTVNVKDAVKGNSVNVVSGTKCTLSDTDSSGVSITGSGHGNISTAGWIDAGDVGSGSSTKYVTGVELGKDTTFTIDDDLGIHWTIQTDSSGNISII